MNHKSLKLSLCLIGTILSNLVRFNSEYSATMPSNSQQSKCEIEQRYFQRGDRNYHRWQECKRHWVRRGEKTDGRVGVAYVGLHPRRYYNYDHGTKNRSSNYLRG